MHFKEQNHFWGTTFCKLVFDLQTSPNTVKLPFFMLQREYRFYRRFEEWTSLLFRKKSTHEIVLLFNQYPYKQILSRRFALWLRRVSITFPEIFIFFEFQSDFGARILKLKPPSVTGRWIETLLTPPLLPTSEFDDVDRTALSSGSFIFTGRTLSTQRFVFDSIKS